MENSAKEGEPPWTSTTTSDEEMLELRKNLGFFMNNFEKIMGNPHVLRMMKIDNPMEVDRSDARVVEAARASVEPSMAARVSMEAARVSREEGDLFGLGLKGQNVLEDHLGLGRPNLDVHEESFRQAKGLGLNGSNGKPIPLNNSFYKVSPNNTFNVDINGPSYASVVNQQAKAFKEPIVLPNNIPEPIIRGEKIIIEIPDELVDRCMANATFDLIGRIQYRKGDSPLPLKDLKEKIQKIWKITNDWKLAPIGRGYFYCRFSSKEDKMKAWAMPWLKTNPGIFKMSKWVKDFNPYTFNATTSNVWIRMFGLSGEMFNPEVMIRIAKGVGTPILVDKASLNFDYAHFARVLVEVNLAEKLPSSVFLSVKGVEKEIDIHFENLPSFCEHCSLIGHDKLDCRNLKRLFEEKRRNEEKHNRKRSRSRTRHVPAGKNNTVGPVENNKEVNKADGTWTEVKNTKKKGIEVVQQAQRPPQGNINTFNNFACLDSVEPKTLDNEKTEFMKDITIGDNVIHIESGDNNISTEVEMEENVNVEEGESLIGDNFNSKEDEQDANDVSPLGESGNIEKEVVNNEEVNKEINPILGDNKNILEDTESAFVPETLEEWKAHNSWADEADREDEEFRKLIECVEAKQAHVTSSFYEDNWGEEEPCYVTKPAYNNSNYTFVEHEQYKATKRALNALTGKKGGGYALRSKRR